VNGQEPIRKLPDEGGRPRRLFARWFEGRRRLRARRAERRNGARQPARGVAGAGGRQRIVDEHAADHCCQVSGDGAAAVDDDGVIAAKGLAQGTRDAGLREEVRGGARIPSQELGGLARSWADERRSRSARRQKADAVPGPPKGGHRAAQEQNVAQGTRADEEDAQG
jgi:hypothetical protein